MNAQDYQANINRATRAYVQGLIALGHVRPDALNHVTQEVTEAVDQWIQVKQIEKEQD